MLDREVINTTYTRQSDCVLILIFVSLCEIYIMLGQVIDFCLKSKGIRNSNITIIFKCDFELCDRFYI